MINMSTRILCAVFIDNYLHISINKYYFKEKVKNYYSENKMHDFKVIDKTIGLLF